MGEDQWSRIPLVLSRTFHTGTGVECLAGPRGKRGVLSLFRAHLYHLHHYTGKCIDLLDNFKAWEPRPQRTLVHGSILVLPVLYPFVFAVPLLWLAELCVSFHPEDKCRFPVRNPQASGPFAVSSATKKRQPYSKKRFIFSNCFCGQRLGSELSGAWWAFGCPTPLPLSLP